MEADGLNHTISHEFFHILTPLNVHSKEIHDFDFNNPKMSALLWMYEVPRNTSPPLHGQFHIFIIRKKAMASAAYSA
jgi:hypothetical protein